VMKRSLEQPSVTDFDESPCESEISPGSVGAGANVGELGVGFDGPAAANVAFRKGLFDGDEEDWADSEEEELQQF